MEHEHVHDFVVGEFWETVQFMWPSLLAGAALAVAGAVIGTFVLLRRQSLVALALPNAVAVGAAAGLRWGATLLPVALAPAGEYVGWPTLPAAVLAVAVMLALLAWANHRQLEHLMLPALLVGGLCLSFLVVAHSAEHLIEIEHLFVGIDVFVTPDQALFVAAVLLACAVLCAMLWRRWLLIAQAPVTAALAGRRPAMWDALFLCLLGLVALLGTDAMGSVIVLVMLFLPAGAALPWTARIPSALALATGLALLMLAGGTVLSIHLQWPLSQSIGGLGFVMLLLSVLAARVMRGR